MTQPRQCSEIDRDALPRSQSVFPCQGVAYGIVGSMGSAIAVHCLHLQDISLQSTLNPKLGGTKHDQRARPSQGSARPMLVGVTVLLK